MSLSGLSPRGVESCAGFSHCGRMYVSGLDERVWVFADDVGGDSR